MGNMELTNDQNSKKIELIFLFVKHLTIDKWESFDIVTFYCLLEQSNAAIDLFVSLLPTHKERLLDLE